MSRDDLGGKPCERDLLERRRDYFINYHDLRRLDRCQLHANPDGKKSQRLRRIWRLNTTFSTRLFVDFQVIR